MKYILFFCLTAFLFSDGPVWTTYLWNDPGPGIEQNHSVEFSPNGDLIVVDGWINVHLLSTEDGEILHTIKNAKSCTFDATGEFIYYIKSGSLFKMDVTTFESTEFIDLVNGGGATYAYNFDKTKLVLGLGKKTDEFGQVISRGLDVYDLYSRELENHVDHWLPSESILTVSNDLRFLQWNYSYYDSNIEEYKSNYVLLDLEKNEEIRLSDIVFIYNFHPSSALALLRQNDKRVLVNTNDFSEIKNLDNLQIRTVNSRYSSPWTDDGTQLAYFSQDNTFSIIDDKFLNEQVETIRFGSTQQIFNIFDYSNIGDNLIIGGGGISLYDLSLYLSVENENVYELTINPNPVNENLYISYHLESPIEVEVYITDILGNQLDIIQTGLQSNLNQTINHPVSNLPTGTYFLTLSANGINESIQFVKE